MDILYRASAGTMESSDAYVEIAPGENGIRIELESVVQAQFGDAICDAVQDVLRCEGIQNADIRIIDRGALECVIRARVEAAVNRGRGKA